MDEGFSQAREVVLAEVAAALNAVNCDEAKEAANAIANARKVFAVGVGRVMLMLQAFVKRLNHLGIDAYYVGEINEPALTSDDVLLVASGSGESAVPVAIINVAKRYSPKILYVGSNTTGTIAKQCDIMLRIPCKTKLNLPGEMPSIQPMSSLFEQSLLLTLDALAFMIMREKRLELDKLWLRHANLE